MRPKDVQDLVIASVLLVVLVVIASVLQVGSGMIYTSDIKIGDESQLFFLNYLRTKTDSGQIANMILLNEGGDHETLMPLQAASKNVLSFYGIEGNYILKAGYPDGSVNFIAASHEWGLPQGQRMNELKEKEKDLWFKLGDGEKIKIPSLKEGFITVEFKRENE